jgi:hypothetical protein
LRRSIHIRVSSRTPPSARFVDAKFAAGHRIPLRRASLELFVALTLESTKGASQSVGVELV